MAIAFVQGTSGTNATGSTNNIVSSAFSSSNTSSNMIVVGVTLDGSAASLTGVSDSAGNTYVKCQESAAGANVAIYAAYNILPFTSNVVTALVGFTDGVIFAQEFSGITTSSAFDVGVVSTGSATTLTATTATTTQANELIFAAAARDYASPDVLSVGTGYSNFLTAHSNSESGAVESKIVSTTGTQTAIMTASVNNSFGWRLAIATFKASSSVAPAVTYISYTPPFLS